MDGSAARTQVLLAAVLFGTTGTAQAIGPALDPLAVGAARIAVGAVLLGAIALAGGAVRARRGPARGPARGRLRRRLPGELLRRARPRPASPSGTVVAIGSAPAFAGLFARAFAGEPLRGRWAAATGLACAGVCLLVLGGGGAAARGRPRAGVGLALVAGAGYAGYAVATKRMLAAGGAPEAIMADRLRGGRPDAAARVRARAGAAGCSTPGGSRSRSTSARFRLRSPTSCSPVGSSRSGRGRRDAHPRRAAHGGRAGRDRARRAPQRDRRGRRRAGARRSGGAGPAPGPGAPGGDPRRGEWLRRSAVEPLGRGVDGRRARGRPALAHLRGRAAPRASGCPSAS